MSKFFSNVPSKKVSSRYIFFDTDFLDRVFKDGEFFTSVTNVLKEASILLDPLTSFEFNRDVLNIREVEERSKFLAAGLFFPASNHATVYSDLILNALLLSKVYKKNGVNGASTVDFLLAARIMYMRGSKPLLLTANRKHFPSCIFTTIGIITYEDNSSGDLTTYPILEFDESKFKKMYEELRLISKPEKIVSSGKGNSTSFLTHKFSN
jgi:hypothetical protein